MPTSREVRLVTRPVGEPDPGCFALAEAQVREPGDGEVLVRNTFLSVDPYMRGRMSDARSYAAPYALGEAMYGGAVGEVVASNADAPAVGDVVLHNLGWREYAVGPARDFRRVDVDGVPPSAYLGVLGMPGLTAYAGLLEVASYREGETVFVSGAAGAVGSLVGQLVKMRGGTAVGSAGSPEKVAWLREIGFDVAFDYKAGRVADQLRAAAPEGIDVYFDNVGGDHLEAAIGALRLNGRIAVCGMISRYNATEPPPGPRNLNLFIAQRLTMRGFLVWDHAHLLPEFEREVGAGVRAGRIAHRETVVDGIDRAVDAFLGLLRGANTGKMVVRL